MVSASILVVDLVMALVFPTFGFHTLDVSKYTAAELPNTESSSADTELQNHMKELQKQFGTAAEEDEKTKQRVENVESEVKSLMKTLKSSSEETAETQKQVEAMADRLKGLESNLASATNLMSSLDNVTETSKAQALDISELKTSKVKTEKKLTAMQQQIGSVTSELQKTKDFMHQKLSGSSNGGQNMHDRNRPNTSSKTNPEGCPSNFDFIPGTKQCLKFMSNTVDNVDAGNEKCAQLHERGSLVILDSNERIDAVQKYLKGKGVHHDVYVGGRIDTRNKRYKWVDDEYIGDDISWCPQQPQGRSCISLWQGMGFCLDDSTCDKKPYLCEVRMEEDYDEEN